MWSTAEVDNSLLRTTWYAFSVICMGKTKAVGRVLIMLGASCAPVWKATTWPCFATEASNTGLYQGGLAALWQHPLWSPQHLHTEWDTRPAVTQLPHAHLPHTQPSSLDNPYLPFSFFVHIKNPVSSSFILHKNGETFDMKNHQVRDYNINIVIFVLINEVQKVMKI